MNILIGGIGSRIHIKRFTRINASKYHPVTINSFEGKSIIIGENCLFSNNIEIHNTDYHPIFEYNGERINYGKDIIIGNHVWIGLRSIILKGSIIPDNTIIGSNSFINKKFTNPNSIIAGNPAFVRKENINWTK